MIGLVYISDCDGVFYWCLCSYKWGFCGWSFEKCLLFFESNWVFFVGFGEWVIYINIVMVNIVCKVFCMLYVNELKNNSVVRDF